MRYMSLLLIASSLTLPTTTVYAAVSTRHKTSFPRKSNAAKSTSSTSADSSLNLATTTVSHKVSKGKSQHAAVAGNIKEAYRQRQHPNISSVKSNEPEQVTVSARYKNEKLQRVPIAISTISGSEIQKMGGVHDLRQLQYNLPGLQISGFSPRNQFVTIRGLGTNANSANEGLDQGVGIYIDGVYYARTGTALSEMLDVSDVQLLKGPQGTLFGKNTVAGAIDIHTKGAGRKFSYGGSFSYGNYAAVRSDYYVNVPINKVVSARLSGVFDRRDGFIRNVRRNERWDNVDTDATKLDIDIHPDNGWHARLIADYSHQVGYMGFTVANEILPTVLANGSSVRGFYTRAAAAGYSPIAIRPFDRRTDIDASHHQQLDTGGISLHLEREMSVGTLSSISAYREWSYQPNYDGDQTGADVMPESIVAPHQRQVSQELRLTGRRGPFDYTGGLYFFWQNDHFPSEQSYGHQASQWYLGPSAPSAILNGLRSLSDADARTYSYAAYGQTTWHATNRLTVTAGLRYTLETKSGNYSQWQGGDVTPIAELPSEWQSTAVTYRNSYAPGGRAYHVSTTRGNLSGIFTLGYQISDAILAYGTYSRGYKSAGLNLVREAPGVNVMVAPEEVDAFEVGVKSQFWHHRATINADIFWTNDHNLQTNVYDPANRVSYIANAGTVQSRGVEVDASVKPIRGLTLSASASYTDARYASYSHAMCSYLYSYQASCNLSGRPLPGVPTWAGALRGEYAWSLTDRFDAYFGSDFTFRSSYFSAVNDDAFSRIPGFGVVGVHLGARRSLHLAGREGILDVSLWVRNLANKNYYNAISINSTTGLSNAALGDPRTYGFTARASF